MLDLQQIKSLGTNNGNVIQGFCESLDRRHLMSVHTSSGNLYFTIAHYSSPHLEPIDATSGVGAGHGQTLINESGNTWWVDSATDGAIQRITLTLSGTTLTPSLGDICQLYTTAYDGNVTIGQSDGDMLVARGADVAGTLGNLIRVFNRSDIIAEFGTSTLPTPVHEWSCPDTPYANDFFQGCCIYKGSVYVLTGRELIAEPNLLRKFSLSGTLEGTATIDKHLQVASIRGTKYEPEGLAVIDGELYFGMMLGDTGNNLKYLINAKSTLQSLS